MVKTEEAKDQFTIKPWMLHVDGASNVNESGARLALNSLGGGGTFKYAIHLEFPSSNNIVQFKVLLASLYLVKSLNAYLFIVFCESQLTVR